MPSALLAALYNRRTDEAAALATRLAPLDIFEAAAIGQAARVLELIAEEPAAASAWSDDGFTALHLAAFFAHPECVQALLAAGADVNARSRNGMSVRPLQSAVTSRSLGCVELLIAAGSDPNARQGGGFTPLHSAVHNGDRAIEAALLGAGADASLRADDGRGMREFRQPRLV
jgi:uncharacterized protein